jgi:hypothetical protein
LLAGLLLLACDGAPPRAASSGPPQWIALDVELPVWELSRWTVSGFTETLRLELEERSIHVERDTGGEAQRRVLVNLGLYNNRHAIDVALAHAGRTVFLGRVTIPDRSMTTLDAAAPLVASVIASGLIPTVDAAPPPPP